MTTQWCVSLPVQRMSLVGSFPCCLSYPIYLNGYLRTTIEITNPEVMISELMVQKESLVQGSVQP
jgi:hypothetical protein